MFHKNISVHPTVRSRILHGRYNLRSPSPDQLIQKDTLMIETECLKSTSLVVKPAPEKWCSPPTQQVSSDLYFSVLLE